jgi:hypothetical protein
VLYVTFIVFNNTKRCPIECFEVKIKDQLHKKFFMQMQCPTCIAIWRGRRDKQMVKKTMLASCLVSEKRSYCNNLAT